MDFLSKDFTPDWHWLAGTTATLFVLIFLRYLLLSGVYHLVFFVGLRKRFERRFLQLKGWKTGQARLEIFRSALSSLIFAAAGAVTLLFWLGGFTKIYKDWQAHPIWWHPASLLIALLLHETYYYWLHRWMHRPKIYRNIHRWHHDSVETSVLTSFSFHPAEAFLQAIFVPVALIFLPMHVFVLLLWLVLMTVSAIVNHAGVEIYPKNFHRHPLGKWLIGAAHHDLHHKRFRCNYGLYFTFWDRWMKTESPDFQAYFEQKTKR